MAFTIPNGVFDIYKEVCDELIANDNIGKDCTLFYPPSIEECPNCIYDSFNRVSTGVYKAGGPLPFSFGPCPWCNGFGKKETEVSETIRLRIYWTKKDWLKFTPVAQIPEADAMTIGYMRDMPKCITAERIRMVKDQQGNIKFDFNLAGEPYPHGFGKDKYFIAFWKRVK